MILLQHIRCQVFHYLSDVDREVNGINLLPEKWSRAASRENNSCWLLVRNYETVLDIFTSQLCTYWEGVILNRPGVAGDVLQKPLSLIHWVCRSVTLFPPDQSGEASWWRACYQRSLVLAAQSSSRRLVVRRSVGRSVGKICEKVTFRVSNGN